MGLSLYAGNGGVFPWGSHSDYHAAKLPLLLFALRTASQRQRRARDLIHVEQCRLYAGVVLAGYQGTLRATSRFYSDRREDIQVDIDNLESEFEDILDAWKEDPASYRFISAEMVPMQELLAETGAIGVLWLVDHDDNEGWLSAGQTADIADLLAPLLADDPSPMPDICALLEVAYHHSWWVEMATFFDNANLNQSSVTYI